MNFDNLIMHNRNMYVMTCKHILFTTIYKPLFHTPSQNVNFCSSFYPFAVEYCLYFKKNNYLCKANFVCSQ